MSAFPKADIQNVRDRVELYGCFWPKADTRTESKSQSVNACFGGRADIGQCLGESDRVSIIHCPGQTGGQR